ncbi:sensor domain-containing diguanylate cyclase [Geotalea sp. SG265]|uniref:sensor domain-containing diguanylate cyclase n=1 Tax=Geotalea sp. SG265 TaxID=2922867 RepID=UPI001FAEE979|nr:sensor domain-containing diguanylate cyclase [Geotalea sp. SG265]
MVENAQEAPPAELLAKLKSYPFLAQYNLNLFCLKKDSSAADEFLPCGSIVQDALSNEIGLNFIGRSLKPELPAKKTAVYRYNGGFLSFVVSFNIGDTDFCLVGNGVRDKLIDFWQLERLSRADKVDVFSLLSQLERLPVATVHELEELAEHIHEMLPALHPGEMYQSLYDQTVNRLAMVVGLLEQMDELKSVNDLVSFTTELLAFVFHFPKVALALLDADRGTYSFVGQMGLERVEDIAKDRLGELLTKDHIKKPLNFDEETAALFSGVSAQNVTLFPLKAEGSHIGFISLFDNEPQAVDALLVELLAAKAAAKIRQLKKETEHLQLNALSNRLLSVTNTLLFAENKEELYKTILELAADLLNSTQGSIMLMDKSGENLHIVFTMGMSLNLAQCMTVKVGKGIAGKVAKTGIPLLVNDIEKDTRIGIKNRPRFKSKSLISIPLKLKDKTIGVLNLSDKGDLGVFTESDKDLLTSFANLASLIIERTLVIEESVIFEKMAVTDALTGLYNRRFLKNRLEEELTRSIRQKLNLTILFIDLDHFKIYNDLCGHIAGDEVLRKTAAIIKASLRDMDVVARYGGEEFCAILPGTSKMESLAVAERIRAGIEREVFPEEENLPLGRLTTSIGVASFPEDGHTFTSLVHAADVALYEAKTVGRNTVVVARHVMDKD